MNTGVTRCHKRPMCSLQLELQEVVRHSTWAVGTAIWPSVIASSSHNYWAIFSVPVLFSDFEGFVQTNYQKDDATQIWEYLHWYLLYLIRLSLVIGSMRTLWYRIFPISKNILCACLLMSWNEKITLILVYFHSTKYWVSKRSSLTLFISPFLH